jgi:hypothetical protein
VSAHRFGEDPDAALETVDRDSAAQRRDRIGRRLKKAV